MGQVEIGSGVGALRNRLRGLGFQVWGVRV